MNFTNKPLFWILRDLYNKLCFFIKEKIYRVIRHFVSRKKYKSFEFSVISTIFKGLVLAVVLELALLTVDSCISEILADHKLDKTVYNSVVVSGIATAVVILGLYCSNISSIYSVSYVNAPAQLASRFYDDRLTRKCIKSIIYYIIFEIIQLIICAYTGEIGWTSFIVSCGWSLYMMITFANARERVYQLSDVYSLAEDSYWILSRTITEYLNISMFSNDKSFQNHFMLVAEKQIDYLKVIQKYASSNEQSGSADNNSRKNFLLHNLSLIYLYWERKKAISLQSDWYRSESIYKKWHSTSDVEAMLSLRSGMPLLKLEKKNKDWFEDEIFSINLSDIKLFFLQRSYDEIIEYIDTLETTRQNAAECNELSCYLKHLNCIKDLVTDSISDIRTEEERIKYAGVIEKMSTAYLNVAFDAEKICSSLNIDDVFVETIKAIDTEKAYDRNKRLMRRGNRNFYCNILTELSIEGKRLTPDWVIKEEISHEEYTKLNSLIIDVNKSVKSAFELCGKCEENNLPFETSVILLKFYELDNVMAKFIESADDLCKQLSNYHIDKKETWEVSEMLSLSDSIKSVKEQVPAMLSKCVAEYAFNNHNGSSERPDIIGESFYHLCEETLNSITSNNLKQFEIDFINLTNLMIIYQEYLRSEYQNEDDGDVERVAYILSSPVTEWGQIGGLGILWGEFVDDEAWKKIIISNVERINNSRSDNSVIMEIADRISYRSMFHFWGTGMKDMLESNWKQRVEEAMKSSSVYRTKPGVYGNELDTKSKLLKEFCSNFELFGFMHDPSEVFMIACINSLLPKDKKINTNYSWENHLNE